MASSSRPCPSDVSFLLVSEKADVSVISYSALQNATNWSLKERAYEPSLEHLLATQKLLDRIALSDEQQEEYDIFIRACGNVDSMLKSLSQSSKIDQKGILQTLSEGFENSIFFVFPFGSGSNQIVALDKATQVFFDLKAQPHPDFLAGSRKDVSKRRKHVGELQSLI